MVLEHRRKRRQRDAARLGRQHLHVILAARVTDDDRVGDPVEIGRGEAVEDGNVRGLELRRHGRVDVLVRPAHLVAALLEQAGERAHPRPADAHEVDPATGPHPTRGIHPFRLQNVAHFQPTWSQR